MTSWVSREKKDGKLRIKEDKEGTQERRKKSFSWSSVNQIKANFCKKIKHKTKIKALTDAKK